MCNSCMSEADDITDVQAHDRAQYDAQAPVTDNGADAPSIEQTPETARVPCQYCGADVEEDTTADTRDGRVCAACARTEYTQCYACEEYVRNDDVGSVDLVVPGRTARRSINLCDSCRRDDYTECEDCGQTTALDDSVEVLRRLLCAHCADDYFTCRRCDGQFHHDDCGDDGYCQSCWDEQLEEQEEERGPIREYSYNVLNALSAFGPRGTVQYGVELEVETPGGARDDLAEEVISVIGEDFVVLKEDGSLDHGFEIVSAPAPLNIHKARWDTLFEWHDKRRKLRSYDTNTCGMHVHISRAGLTQLQIGRMLVFLHNPDNAQFVKHIAQRNPERWASFAAKKKHVDAKRQDGDRYVALNLRPRYTVELRIFKGTLKRESFYKNLEFAAALVAFTAPAERSLIEAGRHEEFVKFVRKNRKLYPHLDDFLVLRGYLPKRTTSPQQEIALCA